MFGKKLNLSFTGSETTLLKAPSIVTKVFRLPNLYMIATDKHLYNIGFFKTHRIPYLGIQNMEIKKNRLYYLLLIKPAKKNKVIKFRSNKKEVFALFNIISNNLMPQRGAKNFNINNSFISKNVDGKDIITNKNNINKDNTKNSLMRGASANSTQKINGRILENNTFLDYTNPRLQSDLLQKYKLFKNNSYVSIYAIYSDIIKNRKLSKKISSYLFSIRSIIYQLHDKSIQEFRNINDRLMKEIENLKAVDYNKIMNLSNLIEVIKNRRFNINTLLSSKVYIKKINNLKSILNKQSKKYINVRNSNKFIFRTAPYFNIHSLDLLIFNTKKEIRQEDNKPDNIEINNKIKQSSYLYNMHIFNVRRIRENVKRIDLFNNLEPANNIEEPIGADNLWFKIK